VVVGEEEKNGGLWCSPRAKTSRPTSSVFFAISTTALMRSCSVGVRPVVGSGVMSLTENTPNCMLILLVGLLTIQPSARLNGNLRRSIPPHHASRGICGVGELAQEWI